MSETNLSIATLIVKFYNDELSDDERERLDRWVGASEENKTFFEQYKDSAYVSARLDAFDTVNTESILRKIEAKRDISVKEKNSPTIGWKWFIAAASLLMMGLFGYFIYHERGTKTIQPIANIERYKNDVLPGGNKATLTLADGSTVVLGGSRTGDLAKQSDAVVQQVDSGQILYKKLNEKPTGSIAYNILTTPAGGQFQVTLPDGSKVWLNAASSLKYPTAFSGKERAVELTGEGYFEVAENKEMPFKVLVNKQSEVQVLGTHFNIFAYPSESEVKTTLLQGKVQVTMGKKTGILEPGQQAILHARQDDITILKDVDTEDQVAWKEGLFRFNKTDLHEIMNQIARWYDVEVVYESTVKHAFSGELPRNVNVSELLHFLESTDQVHFKIEGKKVTVMR